MSHIMSRPSYAFSDVLIPPAYQGKVESRKEVKLDSLVVPKQGLAIPIISANMPAVTESMMAGMLWWTGGIGALHRFNTIAEAREEYVSTRNLGAKAIVSLGLHEKLERAEALWEVDARIFLIDVAHAHSLPVFRFLESLRERFPEASIIAGNVATGYAALDLVKYGADAIKVGIGPGAACTTRQVTGAGRGQLTAIMDVASQVDAPIIADGGISTSGDIVKAIGAGASTVMLGRLLAGCDESPEPGFYWGNASHRQNGHRAPEGVEGTVPRTGSLEDTLKPLLWGLKSGISYAGYGSVQEFVGNATFELISAGVAAESAARIG